MNAVFVLVQILLVIAVVPVLAKSLRTSRSRRSHHSACLTLAGLLAFLAIMVSLFSLASAADDSRFNHLLAFLPPLFTLCACTVITWRAISSANRPHPRRRRAVDGAPSSH